MKAKLSTWPYITLLHIHVFMNIFLMEMALSHGVQPRVMQDNGYMLSSCYYRAEAIFFTNPSTNMCIKEEIDIAAVCCAPSCGCENKGRTTHQEK